MDNNLLHWKRIVHIIVTFFFIAFIIWYYLPDNRLIRSVDVCGYYAVKTNQTCSCTPVGRESSRTIITIFYPNFSYYKIKPFIPSIDYGFPNLTIGIAG